MALSHKDFVSLKPSIIARASLGLSRKILGCPGFLGDLGSRSDLGAAESLVQAPIHPSQVIFRKYASPRTFSVSITLDHFLRQQEDMNKPAIMRTPLFEPDMQVLVQNQGVFPSTPQTRLGNMADSYLTPPITPEEGCILNENEPTIPRVRLLSTIWNPRCQW